MIEDIPDVDDSDFEEFMEFLRLNREEINRWPEWKRTMYNWPPKPRGEVDDG
jgi:hypothetical protein